MSYRRSMSVGTALVGLAALGCTGVIDADSQQPTGASLPAAPAVMGDPAPGTQPGPIAPEPPRVVETPTGTLNVVPGVNALRRLTRSEFDATIADLLMLRDATSSTVLPPDGLTPFDNNYEEQGSSLALITAIESQARKLATATVAYAARRTALLPCTPKAANDAACLASFIRSFGRRALRRPLGEPEVAELVALGAFSQEKNDFGEGLRLVIGAILLHPEFLYRVELGTRSDGSPFFRLAPHELASRLSYFLIGSMPPAWLAELADRGLLTTRMAVRPAAERLLEDPRAMKRLKDFHAMWLGYQELPHDAARNARFRGESDALVERVYREQGSYLELFTSGRTFVDATLATHYGLRTSGTTAGWVEYTGVPRKGILSHASFLSTDRMETSPVDRGKRVQEQLLCDPVPIPPFDVNADSVEKNAPNGSPCKYDRYAAHREKPMCAVCHKLLDDVGFGLEGFDRMGRSRTTDEGLPQCTVRDEGTVAGTKFRGTAGLADAVIASGRLETCFVTHLYEFAMGRPDKPEDQGFITTLTRTFTGKNRVMKELLLAFVSDPVFGEVNLTALRALGYQGPFAELTQTVPELML